MCASTFANTFIGSADQDGCGAMAMPSPTAMTLAIKARRSRLVMPRR
jgi:hypothetical protein